MICQNCGANAETKGRVVSGKFYEALCDTCSLANNRTPNNQAAEYSRTVNRSDHAKDIIQPWDGDKPNPDFIRAYPVQAEQTFTKKELRQYG